MRYPAGHKGRSRDRIVEVAARLFRARGITSTGIDAVMSAVGLTAGGFYAHFSSKRSLVADVVRKAFAEGAARLASDEREPAAWVADVLRRYVNRGHRDRPDEGCPLSTMLSELPQVADVVRPILDAEVGRYVALFEARLSGAAATSPRQRALATVAMMVGAVALARALGPTPLSDELLAACPAVGVSFVAGRRKVLRRDHP